MIAQIQSDFTSSRGFTSIMFAGVVSWHMSGKLTVKLGKKNQFFA
jgi:hypothetical protein